MRYIVLVLLFVVVVYADHINWQKDYETARLKAVAQKKHILVFLIEQHTQKTNKIIQDSFMNQAYIQTVNKDFVSVIVHSESYESYPIELLYTTELPALFFLSNDELFLCDALEGIITPQKIKEKLLECR